jgi:hypothetical protein
MPNPDFNVGQVSDWLFDRVLAGCTPAQQNSTQYLAIRGRKHVAMTACASSGRPCDSAHGLCERKYEMARFLRLNRYDHRLIGIGTEIAAMQSGIMN